MLTRGDASTPDACPPSCRGERGGVELPRRRSPCLAGVAERGVSERLPLCLWGRRQRLCRRSGLLVSVLAAAAARRASPRLGLDQLWGTLGGGMLVPASDSAGTWPNPWPPRPRLELLLIPSSFACSSSSQAVASLSSKDVRPSSSRTISWREANFQPSVALVSRALVLCMRRSAQRAGCPFLR